MTPGEKQLTDRYLENSLTGIELKEFHERLESDEIFRNDVSFQNLLIESIRLAEDKRLSKLIVNHIDYKKPLVPLGLRLIFTFLLITTGGIILWNYVGPGSSGNKHRYLSLEFLKQNTKNKNVLDTIEKKAFVKKAEPKSGIIQVERQVEAGSNTDLRDTENVEQSNLDEIVVKKDQLLSSLNLKMLIINEKTENQETNDESITRSTVSKLNPAGGLPEQENENSPDINVEFWVSPVNFKGYKLYDDKLILFGIDAPDAIKLYLTENKIWLRYGQDLFLLQPSDQFESFIPPTEIPSALK